MMRISPGCRLDVSPEVDNMTEIGDCRRWILLRKLMILARKYYEETFVPLGDSGIQIDVVALMPAIIRVLNASEKCFLSNLLIRHAIGLTCF